MDQETADEILKELRAQNPKRLRVPLAMLGVMLLFFISLVIWDVMPKGTKHDEASWTRVNQAMDNGNLTEALQVAQELMRRTPNYPGGYAALASIYFQMGNLREAEKYYTRAYELLPSEEFKEYLQKVRLVRGALTNESVSSE